MAQASFLKSYVMPKALFLTVGLPKGSFGSIDITNRCQLRCKHCYFFEQENPVELTDEQWLDRVKELTSGKSPMRSVTWVGGEPLLRKNLIDKARKYFSHNMLVTNGLMSLPDWHDVSFHVSIDGDEEAHEKMRNQKNIYKRIMKNVSRPDLDVTIAYCISTLNIDMVEKVLDEWHHTGVKGFLFSFYTPIETIKDPLFPGWEGRDAIIRRLLELKRDKYGDFIRNESEVLELMLSENSKEVTDNCVYLTKGMPIGPEGHQKEKCMMGEKADCDRCGCIVPFYLAYRSDRKRIMKEIYTDFSSYLSSRVRHLFSAQ